MKNLETKTKINIEENNDFVSPSVYQDNIVKILKSISGRYSIYDVFSDWVEIMALTLANSCRLVHDSVWKERENKYLQLYAKYNKEEFEKFSQCFAYLVLAFENFNFDDMLGSIYMKLGCGNKETGQFFTPYHVSQLMAETSMSIDYDGTEVITINEPTVGAGGMIIAVAEVLYKRGHNPQKCLKVTAQDLDWKAVYMSYVQFSLLGLNAEVAQGNTLTEPYISGKFPPNRVFLTPKRCGVLL